MVHPSDTAHIPELREEQFILGVLHGLTQHDITAIVPPELDLERHGDKAIVATFDYLDTHQEESRFSEAFAVKMFIGRHRMYGHCSQWRETLHSAGGSGLLYPNVRTGLLDLDVDELRLYGESLPGTPELWHELAGVYLQTYRGA